jgi:hypothetical protein
MGNVFFTWPTNYYISCNNLWPTLWISGSLATSVQRCIQPPCHKRGILPSMNSHPYVQHPSELLEQARAEKKAHESTFTYRNNLFLEWVTNHILASVTLFDIALIVPLLTVPAPDSVKITLGVISGSWIQWWALPALQRSQNKTQAQNDAKAAVDHKTLTYLATLQDEQMTELKDITAIIKALKSK